VHTQERDFDNIFLRWSPVQVWQQLTLNCGIIGTDASVTTHIHFNIVIISPYILNTLSKYERSF